MRTIPAAMAAKIAAGDFTGQTNKATTRVTIQKVQLGIHGTGDQTYSSINFVGSSDPARELPNVKSVSWERSADSDVGSATIELWNTTPLAPGQAPDVADSFDLIGYYTYNRGRTSYSQGNWGHTPNRWQDFIVPDRMIRIYQGYGANYGVLPENDTNLVQTGVFLIDDVTYTADGLITVECRDVARLLYDQIMFPPVVPLAHYPLKFEQYRQVPNPPKVSTSAVWSRPTYEGSSNGKKGSSTETQWGRHPADAFDGNTDSFWLSLGHDVPNHPSSFEWIQGALSGSQPLQGVKFAVRGGPYRVYLSVYTDKAVGGKSTGWNGTVTIPYKIAVDPPGTGTGLIDRFAAIKYSKTAVVAKGAEHVFTFPAVKGVTKVRLTFTDLYNSGNQMPAGWTKSSAKGVYRVAVRDFQVSSAVTTTADGGTHTEGNYGDYSEIVKRLLAYGGFFWPQSGKMVLTDGNTKTYTFAGDGDPYLNNAEAGMTGNALSTKGRVWGDIQMAGTSGPAALGIEVWDKKPLIDGINYVKDILGFVFYVDETGGAIFRSPNTFKLGNWKTDATDLNAVRTSEFITIKDNEVILGLRSKLSSRNLREHVFVANVDGKKGAVSTGRIPHPSNFRRVGGWTDQNFATEAECQVMADLITLRQLFTFRRNSLRIPANPAIQVDDQVKIIERTTGDAYFHYVNSISSSWDLESGKWIYDLTTSWLGDSPSGEWAISTSTLSPYTQTFLQALGQI